VNDELEDVEENGRGLILRTIRAFVWRDWEKPWKTRQDSSSPDRHLNPEPSQYEWVLTSRPQNWSRCCPGVSQGHCCAVGRSCTNAVSCHCFVLDHSRTVIPRPLFSKRLPSITVVLDIRSNYCATMGPEVATTATDRLTDRQTDRHVRACNLYFAQARARRKSKFATSKNKIWWCGLDHHAMKKIRWILSSTFRPPYPRGQIPRHPD
jgi:hypothetical protein